MVFVTYASLAAGQLPYFVFLQRRLLGKFVDNTQLCMLEGTLESTEMGKRILWESGQLEGVEVNMGLGALESGSNSLKDRVVHICYCMALDRVDNFSAPPSFCQKRFETGVSKRMVVCLAVVVAEMIVDSVKHYFRSLWKRPA